MGFDKKDALADIDAVLVRSYSNLSTVTKWVAEASALEACIDRYTDEQSTYRRQVALFHDKISHPNTGSYAVAALRGILTTLRSDVESDSLLRLQSRISADIFSDLLSQAESLIADKYVLPAAVLAGATLEEHLRKLAVKSSLPIVDANSGKPRKAATLNADLKQANVYSNAQHAQVDAWQKIRNDAAHADPDFPKKHTNGDIERMIAGIRDFIIKHPS